MATIGTATFVEDGTHNYMRMVSGEQYLRPMVMPVGWSVINIGVMYSVEATAACNGGLWIGLCSSTQPTNGYKQFASCQRMVGGGNGWIGVGQGYSSTFGNWAYTPFTSDISGSTVNTNARFGYAFSGSSATKQSGGGNTGTHSSPTTENRVRKQALWFSFNKATGNYAMIVANDYTGSTGTNHNQTYNAFLSAINQNGVAGNARTLDNVSYDASSIYTVTWGATDDANYPLDTVNVWWTGSVPIRIYAIAAAVVK